MVSIIFELNQNFWSFIREIFKYGVTLNLARQRKKLKTLILKVRYIKETGLELQNWLSRYLNWSVHAYLVTQQFLVGKLYTEAVQLMIYSKTCLIRHLCNPFSCVNQHLFSWPFYHFLYLIHYAIQHPVYSNTKYLSQCMSDIR